MFRFVALQHLNVYTSKSSVYINNKGVLFWFQDLLCWTVSVTSLANSGFYRRQSDMTSKFVQHRLLIQHLFPWFTKITQDLAAFCTFQPFWNFSTFIACWNRPSRFVLRFHRIYFAILFSLHFLFSMFWLFLELMAFCLLKLPAQICSIWFSYCNFRRDSQRWPSTRSKRTECHLVYIL